MIILLSLFLVCAILGLVGCAWAMVCNVRTLHQRGLLIDAIAAAIRASGYEMDYWPALDSVSYERHMWRLATFRNHWAEYVGLPPSFLTEVSA